MKLIAFFLLFISSGTFAQASNIQNLIDTALKNPGSLIIHIKPLKSTSLDPTDMSYYMENAKEYSKKVLDTFMFAQIIRNSNHTDTSFWTDAELPTFLLVHERNESISRRYAIQKLRPKTRRKPGTSADTSMNSTQLIRRTEILFIIQGRYLTIRKDMLSFNGIMDTAGLTAVVV